MDWRMLGRKDINAVIQFDLASVFYLKSTVPQIEKRR